jgi:hypothetical protein
MYKVLRPTEQPIYVQATAKREVSNPRPLGFSTYTIALTAMRRGLTLSPKIREETADEPKLFSAEMTGQSGSIPRACKLAFS